MPTRTSLMLGWLIVFGASFVLFLAIALLAWLQRRRLEPPPPRRPRLPRARRAQREAERAERAEWEAHAAAVKQRSAQAATRAAEARAKVAEAEQVRAQAWQELEEAQRAYEAAERAYQQASSDRASRPVDPSGQREVAKAALAAYRRGDLSQEELLRVWRWGSGWDPELEQRERTLRQVRAGRRDANLRYRAAASAERAAVEQAEVAEAEARALSEEGQFVARFAAGEVEREGGREGGPSSGAGMTGWQ